MEINRCVSCEQEIESYPCPQCGFDIATPQPEYALPYNHVLHGRYLIGKVLGQGGFGITYIGWDLALEVKVAIKEYYPNGQVTRNMTNTCLNWYSNAQAVALRENGMETFMKEARKMARVERINEVIRVRDTFAENETAYIVMDFAEGQTLKSRLEKSGVLNWEEAKNIFFPVISAMGQVHKAGIIHRDLSPDNLMLLPDGGVRILDLGAAKDLTVNNGISSMQVIKGGFSPIEQYSQSGGSGPWTDVYAMAATMYYALTGKLPTAAVDRLGTDPLGWDLPQLQSLPKSALEALKKAMVVMAKERTQSMEELLHDLQKETIQTVAPPKIKVSESPKVLRKEPPTEDKVAQKDKRVLPWLLGVMLAVMLVGIYALRSLDNLTGSQKSLLETPTTVEHASIQTEATEQTVQMEDPAVPAALPPIQPGAKCVQPVFGTISANYRRCAGIREDGTVVYAGDFYDADKVDQYQDVVQIDWGTIELFALKKDGTIVSADFRGAPKNVIEGKFIQFAARGNALIALKPDGTVVSLKYSQAREEVSGWRNIKAIDINYYMAMGLKKDGTVVIAGDDPPDVSSWHDIVQVSAGGEIVAGLRADGTVEFEVMGPYYLDKYESVKTWTDIVAISVGEYHIVGLRSDGRVIAAGSNSDGECNVYDWTDIVAVSADWGYTIGLKSDGTVVAVGANEDGQCNVSGWRNIRTS